jgi:hypothetical protein
MEGVACLEEGGGHKDLIGFAEIEGWELVKGQQPAVVFRVWRALWVWWSETGGYWGNAISAAGL